MRQSALSVAMKAPASGPREWYRLENKAKDDNTDLYIYDEIGGGWFGGVSAQDLVDELKDIKTGQITVHINSPGGAIFDGLAIYNSLKTHSAKVITVVDALAASAASFIAQAGDEVVMARNAVMMIHDGSGMVYGNAKDMHDMAALLDKLSDNIADIYTQRAGGNIEFWRAAMKEETWYTGTEAVDAGLADKVTEDENKDAETAANRWDLSIFNFAGRGAAPPPATVHNKIKKQLRNQAQEAPVAGTPKAHVEGETAPVTEEETVATEEVTEPVEATPAVEETEEAGVNGDGQPVPGTQPANSAGSITFKVGGKTVSDPRAVQAHIDALETAQAEARDGARQEFVNQLVSTNRLPATELTATVEFALELEDAQYERWTRQWTNAAALPLLAQHGGDTSNHQGAGSLPRDTAEDEAEKCEAIVRYHMQGGRSKEFIMTTPSYATLISLKPDFKL